MFYMLTQQEKGILKKATQKQFVEFIYSEKATNFCKISTVDLSDVVTDQSTVEISQNFVTVSEYMNFDESEYVFQQSNLEIH